MWWLKAIVSALVIINIGSGNPILNNEELHNIEENKFREVPAIKQKTKLVDAEESYRLPNTSIPLSYDITIRTDIHNAIFDFSGYVKIHAKILEATEEIILHYRQIEIDYIDLFNSTGIVASDLKFEKISKFEFLNITLPRIYNPDEEIILEIAYHGEIRRDGGGFYYGSYTNEEGQNVYYATTQFEVTDARHAMPCYDEPGIRAPMTLTIIHGKKYSVVANMNIDSQENQGGYTVTKFKPTPSIQTYLLAFLISDFDYVSATNNSRISQKIYAKPEAIKNGEGDFAASVVGDVLARLEEVLKFNYPNDKMDHAALNYFNFGAMENFGLITYIDRGLLLNPSLTENQKYISQNSITGLIAHEFAHQWFGNIISPKWWTYTWLNEGFATLFASYIPHLIYPERNIFARGYINNIRTAFANDVNNSWAMNHYTELPNELWSKFGAIGYQKSGCVLRMFMEVMTREVFFNGLNYYLTANNMQAATPAELHVGLQTAYDQANFTTPLNIDQLMSTWENQAGYPLVTVTISGNNLQFSQKNTHQE
ncbi:hypothetical protein PVAND_009752 [Polypedilum vanderplanki]|uniref:Aminopeptidase N n=1 Tax=Polypedilum vanderplanki TaxID=319348 RepID=A0A9J6CE68_POLVA|nr:hypothetical protein PVAND_009752 [Polypedilum vanderplanki]